MVDCFILLNSGDYVLLNDGTSKVQMNSCEAPGGVFVTGTHAVAQIMDVGPKVKKRIRRFDLIAKAKITRKMPTTFARGQLFKVTSSESKGKITKLTDHVIRAKITRLHERLIPTPYVKMTDEQYRRTKYFHEHVKTTKVNRLKDLLKEYRDEFDDEDWQ